MEMMATKQSPLPSVLRNMVLLEEAGAVEHWRYDEDGSVHVLLQLPIASLGCCGREHCWLINRDGKTRCIDCDLEHRAITAQKLRDLSREVFSNP